MRALPRFHQKPIVATKLRPPSNAAALVARPRLTDALAHVLTRRLALIHAPAGFGKTTLAVQWSDSLAAREVTTSWLSLDAADNDLPKFLAYVVEAIRIVEPDIGSGLTALIESSVEGVAEFVLGELVNEFQTYDREFVLFLDDWHLIHDFTIHAAVDFLLSRAPANFHLIVTSRSRENLPLARLRVQDELVEIDSADLRFSHAESNSFFEGAKVQKLGRDEVESLWRSTEGWVAALQLASISLRRTGARERILSWAAGSPNDVGDYLAENVLSSLPVRLVDFMLKTSVLGRLSADLCLAVTGEPASADLLDQMVRQELFLLPLDDEHHWFRYHHLFAKFLQRRLERELPMQIQGFHIAAAKWLSRRGQTAEALEHALAAGDIRLAIELVEKDAMALVQNSYMATVLGLVSQLPRAQTTYRPRLQTAVAWAHCLTHHPPEAEEALFNVLQAADSLDPEARKLLIDEANVIRGCIDVYADRIDRIVILVQPCLDNRASFQPWVVGVAANLLAYRYLLTNQLDLVAPLEAWARAYQDRAEGLFSGVYGRCFSGMASLASAELKVAKRHFLDAVVLARNTTGRQSHAARLAGALLGQLQYEMNELEDATQLLEESRILGFEGGVADTYMATYVVGARLRAQKGDSSGAHEILNEGQSTARHLRLDRLAASVAAEQVHLSLRQGDRSSAQRALADFGPQLRDAEPATSEVDAQIWEILQQARARLLVEQGHFDAAIDVLRVLLRRARDSSRLYLEVRLSVALVVALDISGQSARAEDLLAHAVAQAVRCGMVRSILDEGPHVVAVLERLREKARQQQDCAESPSTFGASAELLISAANDPERGICVQPESATLSITQGKQQFEDFLKPREIEILRYLDQGHSNKEIARTLSISVDTVKWYLKGVFLKLGVTRRGHAIAEARRLHMLGRFPRG